MQRIRILYALIVAAIGLGVIVASTAVADDSDERGKRPSRKSHEVWTIDQTDSRAGYGGYLHVYDGDELQADAATAQPETIDLAGAASELCLRKTGVNPVRPHMIVLNGGDFDGPGGNRYAAISSRSSRCAAAGPMTSSPTTRRWRSAHAASRSSSPRSC